MSELALPGFVARLAGDLETIGRSRPTAVGHSVCLLRETAAGKNGATGALRDWARDQITAMLSAKAAMSNRMRSAVERAERAKHPLTEAEREQLVELLRERDEPEDRMLLEAVQTPPGRTAGDALVSRASGHPQPSGSFEQLHPRAQGGKFGAKGGAAAAPKAVAKGRKGKTAARVAGQPNIGQVQQMLQLLGFDVGVTGAMTEQTRGALAAFQKRMGLMPTGRIDNATLSMLNQQRAKREAGPGKWDVVVSGEQRSAGASRGHAPTPPRPPVKTTKKAGKKMPAKTKVRMSEASAVGNPPVANSPSSQTGGKGVNTAWGGFLPPALASGVLGNPPGEEGDEMVAVLERLLEQAVADRKAAADGRDFTEAWTRERALRGKLDRLSEVKSSAYPSLHRSPKSNWVEKAGGLPSYIERIAKHLHYEGGKEIGTAIAIAVNAVKKMCSSGDTNLPGAQQVNAKSRAEACAAVADWEKKKASTKLKEAVALMEAAWDSEDREQRPFYPSVEQAFALAEAARQYHLRESFPGLELSEFGRWDERLHPRDREGQFMDVLGKLVSGGGGPKTPKGRGGVKATPDQLAAVARRNPMVAEKLKSHGITMGGGEFERGLPPRLSWVKKRASAIIASREKSGDTPQGYRYEATKEAERDYIRAASTARARRQVSAMSMASPGHDGAKSLLGKHGIPYDRSGEGLSSRPDVTPLENGGFRVVWRYDDFEGPDKSHTHPMAVDVTATGVKNVEKEHFGSSFSSAGGRQPFGNFKPMGTSDRRAPNTSTWTEEDWNSKADHVLRSLADAGDARASAAIVRRAVKIRSGPGYGEQERQNRLAALGHGEPKRAEQVAAIKKRVGTPAHRYAVAAGRKERASRGMSGGDLPETYKQGFEHGAAGRPYQMSNDEMYRLGHRKGRESISPAPVSIKVGGQTYTGSPDMLHVRDPGEDMEDLFNRGMASPPYGVVANAGLPPGETADEATLLRRAPLYDIATMIRREWGQQGKGVSPYAKPWLDALGSISSVEDNYGAESGQMVIAYLMSNMSGFKGEKAKAIKAELKRRTKPSGSKMSRRSGHELLRESAFTGGTVHFDPHKHPRDRAGQFANVLSKLSHGTARLPSGVHVRKQPSGQYTIHHEAGSTGYRDPRQAAERALHHHDEAEKRKRAKKLRDEGLARSKAAMERSTHRKPVKYGGVGLGEATLTAGAREKLPTSAFAIPPDRYPIHDLAHARNALARVAQHGTLAEKAKVRSAVKRKYPNIGSE